MAQGDFTREEAEETEKSFTEVFKALTKSKLGEFVGNANDIYLFSARNANDIYLFLAICKKKCPAEKK